MTTLLVSIILSQLALEGITAYLLFTNYRNCRYRLQFAIKKFLGIDDLHGHLNDNSRWLDGRITDVEKVVKRIRRAQKGKKPVTPAEPDRFAEVKDYLKQGKRIEAIKAYRNLTDSTLREAVDVTNRMSEELNLS